MFGNIQTANDKYPIGVVRIWRSLFKGYLKNEKHFLNFLGIFWNLHQILNIFKKKKIFIATVFPKLQTVKDLVRPLSEKCSFKNFSGSEHVKGPQTFVELEWEHFYDIFSSLWEEMIWKIDSLLKFDILGLFVNTLAANYKYSVQDCENSSFSIQTQLSWKRTIFSQFYVPFLESSSNFKHLEKKEDRHS